MASDVHTKLQKHKYINKRCVLPNSFHTLLKIRKTTAVLVGKLKLFVVLVDHSVRVMWELRQKQGVAYLVK